MDHGRRIPKLPVDAGGRQAALQIALGVDLVDEWKQRALARLRREQLEQGGDRALEARPLRCLLGAMRVLSSAAWRTRRDLAFAAIVTGDPLAAHLAMQRLPRSQLTVELVAAYLTCCNRRDEAMALLWDARALGQRARETTKLLVDLLAMRGAKSEALGVIRQDYGLFTPDDLSALEQAGLLPD